jgi:hypothetical protein
MRSASQNGLARARGRDARKAKRTPKRHAAWISLNSASAHMPCVVWDLSEGGARLAAPRSHVLPAMFNLILAKDGKSQRLCRIAWRSESQVGVQFIQDANVDLDYPQTRSRAKVEAAKSQGPASGSERRHIAFSSFAFALAVLLTAATVVFAWASQKAGADPAWAGQVCNSAKNLCNHPELTGAAAALMALIYLSARGMER